jgi:DNA adenine methylase
MSQNSLLNANKISSNLQYNLFESDILSFKERKNLFLSKLLSPSGGKTKYKRYLGSPLRYAGGKSLAVGYIIENLPDNLTKLVSPFMGGGSVEIAIAKELNIPVIAYDIFDILVNYWQVQINSPLDLYNNLSKLDSNKNVYEEIKNILKQHWNKIDGYDGNLSQIDLATYYFYNHNLSYGPGFLGWMSSIYENKAKYNSAIEKVKNFSASYLTVQCEKFEDSIIKHNNDFLYLDPPYYLDGDSKMFKGIYPMRNFPIHHNKFNHDYLADILDNHKAGWILSYNDCEYIRDRYKNYKIVDVAWQYTMGQGETRIGKNRQERSYDKQNIKTSHEVLIIKN